MKKLIFTLSMMCLFVASSWSQTTQIQSSDCNITLADMQQPILADIVSGADRYEFRWVNGTDVLTLDRNTFGVRGELMLGLNYGTTYQVSVRYRDAISGVYSAFGTACPVTTASAAGILTSVDPTSFTCGTSVPSFLTNVFVNPIANAVGYEFRFTAAVGSTAPTVTYFGIQPGVRGILVPGLQYNETYDMDVRWQGANSTFSNFGPSCEISTPITTVITPGFCGSTLPTMQTNLTTSPVPGAASYIWKFEDQTANSTIVLTIPRNNEWIRPELIPGVGYGTIYSVSVAWVSSTGTVSDFDNNPCLVTMPSAAGIFTQLNTVSCAVTTMTSMNQNLFADPISAAVGYEFTFTEISTGTDIVRTRTTAGIRGTLLPGINYDETYQVSVKWIQGNGIKSAAGTICTINTPSSAGLTTNLTVSCGSTFGMNDALTATAIPSASAYEFRFTNTSTSTVYTRIRYTPNVRGSYVPGIVDGNYNVDVRWRQANGTFSAFGSVCNITFAAPPAPGSFVINNSGANGNITTKSAIANTPDATTLVVNAYPNPTAGQTIIESNNSIDKVEVYSIAGKLVYSTSPAANNVAVDLSDYDNGIYLVRVYAGNNTELVKVVKR